jgi:hypothetical protein
VDLDMSEPAGAAGATNGAGAATPPELSELGLVVGERVRWRPKPGGRWREGRVVGRERDGSIGVRDAGGASRALRLERLEVTGEGPRGARIWEAALDRAARAGQMALFAAAAAPAPPGGDPGPRPRPEFRAR